MPAEKNGCNCAGKLQCMSAELRGEIIIWDSGGVQYPSLVEGELGLSTQMVQKIAQALSLTSVVYNSASENTRLPSPSSSRI
jgi:hypothetical protein